MTNADEDLTRELDVVERARQGDHDAFVVLYRQDAPPAWRLALALTNDADRAADAVAEGFRRTLAPMRAGAARSDTPFRLRLLTASRHAALDGPSRRATPLATPHAPDPHGPPRPPAKERAAEVMAAFGKLPERWRTVLWLLVVEGLGSLDAARVIKVSPEDAEELAERAQAGLRERWTRDQREAGIDEPDPPEHLDRQLQPVLPLPRELFAVTEARWLATRRREPGPLKLVLPGGRPVPRWAERGLVGATAALIAVGITSALAIDRDPTRGTTEAAADGDGSSTTMPPEPKAYLDDGPTTIGTAASGRRGVAAAGSVGGRAVGGDVGVLSNATATPADGDAAASTGPPAATTLAPLLEVTAGVGHTLGLSVGDQCTGIELLGAVVGCPPATKDDGLTLDVDSSLLGG